MIVVCESQFNFVFRDQIGQLMEQHPMLQTITMKNHIFLYSGEIKDLLENFNILYFSCHADARFKRKIHRRIAQLAQVQGIVFQDISNPADLLH